MKIEPSRKCAEIAGIIGAELVGESDILVGGFNEIHRAEPGDLVFVDSSKYYDKALQSQASAILINKRVDCPFGKSLLISTDPFRDFNILIRNFYTPAFFNGNNENISFPDTVSKTAVIGANTIICPGAYISDHVKIGENCIIHPNVTLYEMTEIGNNVIIHSNTVIGSDAFYYKKRIVGYDKFHSCGRVLIGKEVEIGAGCTIDRGVTGDTVIGSGTKIDNLVHIGHDTLIGKNCLIAAQVGISGTVTIGDNVTIWGQVGIISGIIIGSGATVMAQSGVSKHLEGNNVYFGSPAIENRKKLRELAAIRKLPEYLWGNEHFSPPKRRTFLPPDLHESSQFP